jgi:hypothetical protein
MEVEQGSPIDHGMAKFTMLRALQSADQAVGKIASLGEAISSVTLSGPRVKAIKQPHAEIALYEVREDLAEEFKCMNKLDAAQISAKAQRSESFGKYTGAVFQLKRKDGTSTTIATLWQHENDYWRMISYDVDPQVDRSNAPNLKPSAPAAPVMTYVAGDPEMTRAASDFLKQWFVKKDYERAVGWMAPQSLACANLYRAEGTPEAKTPEEAGALVKSGMSRVAAAAGPVKNLQDAIQAPAVDHPSMKLVKHDDSRSFAIASIPDDMALAASCDHRKPDGEPNYTSSAASGYGKYYGSGFELKLGKADPAVLWLVWGKESNSWKVVSYVVLSP